MSETYIPFKNRTGPFKKSIPSTTLSSGLLGGVGSPEGVIMGNVGQLYQDTDTNELWQKQAGTGKIGWTLVGISPTTVTSGSGSGTGTGVTQVFSGTSTDPNGVITALAPAIYYGTVDGSIWVKTGAGTTNTGWEKIL